MVGIVGIVGGAVRCCTEGEGAVYIREGAFGGVHQEGHRVPEGVRGDGGAAQPVGARVLGPLRRQPEAGAAERRGVCEEDVPHLHPPGQGVVTRGRGCQGVNKLEWRGSVTRRRGVIRKYVLR